MKKVVVSFITFIVIAISPLSATETDLHINQQALPIPAKSLISNYFEHAQIVAVVQNRENKRFEVRTSDGKKIDFKESGEWILIDCNREEIPFPLVPKKIRTVIAKKYGPYVHAIEMKRKKNEITVELNNHIELTFKI